jgi:hypothetical protein
MEMKTLSDLAMIALVGIVTVTGVTLIVSLVSSYLPAKPAVYFILWAFVLIPAVLLIVGALVAREAYYACRGPNESILVATVVALVSAIAGLVLWQIARPSTSMPDFIGLYMNTVGADGYTDFAYLMVVFALAGAIGGIVDYYISQGRRCDIRNLEKR